MITNKHDILKLALLPKLYLPKTALSRFEVASFKNIHSG